MEMMCAQRSLHGSKVNCDGDSSTSGDDKEYIPPKTTRPRKKTKEYKQKPEVVEEALAIEKHVRTGELLLKVKCIGKRSTQLLPMERVLWCEKLCTFFEEIQEMRQYLESQEVWEVKPVINDKHETGEVKKPGENRHQEVKNVGTRKVEKANEGKVGENKEPEKKRWKCKECEKWFNSRSTRSTHLKKDHYKRRYECVICKDKTKLYTTRNAAAEHVQSFHLRVVFADKMEMKDCIKEVGLPDLQPVASLPTLPDTPGDSLEGQRRRFQNLSY